MKTSITISMFAMAAILFSCTKETGVSPQPVQNASAISSASGKPGGSVAAPGVTPTPAVPVAPVTDTVTSALPIADIVTKGTWQVTSYFEGTSSATDKFKGYTFVFNPSGTLTASQNGKDTFGTWFYSTAVFYYGIPYYGSSPFGFNILLGTAKPLGLLSKNLFISKKTTTNVDMDSVNPAENAHVTFVKISN